ncbi:hypothetical protein EAI_06421, partial [Harpegnathos saltator]
KIIFSDEAHFHLDGLVNGRQNCRIWGAENPRAIVEKQMHPQRVTVWCGLKASSDHSSEENAAGQAITAVNGARYRDMINQFFVPKLQDMDVDDMWFQQDGATCHTARETIQLLHESFPGRVISRFGDQIVRFLFGGFLKSKVYANKPTTIHALKEEIERCKTVMENF